MRLGGLHLASPAQAQQNCAAGAQGERYAQLTLAGCLRASPLAMSAGPVPPKHCRLSAHIQNMIPLSPLGRVLQVTVTALIRLRSPGAQIQSNNVDPSRSHLHGISEELFDQTTAKTSPLWTAMHHAKEGSLFSQECELKDQR